MSGHLFVTLADLSTLACDAWLLPTDRALSVTPGWLSAAPPDVSDRFQRGFFADPTPDGWGETVRTFPCTGWHRDGADQAWFTDIGRARASDAWYFKGARQFIEQAAASIVTPARQRSRPLLGLPLVGTGAGGGRKVSGRIATGLLVWEGRISCPRAPTNARRRPVRRRGISSRRPRRGCAREKCPRVRRRRP